MLQAKEATALQHQVYNEALGTYLIKNIYGEFLYISK